MAAIGLSLAAPICLVISAIILLQDGKPIIFTQKRVGKDGKIFSLFKFRTMIKDAEKKTGAVFAGKDDPRITAFGRFLRVSRLDEIPQLVNVLRGDMSLIGPRPERPEFTNDFVKQIPFYDKRLHVKPGVTGWAQVRFPYASSLDDTRKKLEYDLFYIKNRSISMTLSILFQTVAVVFTGRGAR
jgi:lipopolysaccharide/colanic/teichoic acid biosynthesis glycosyltransferase